MGTESNKLIYAQHCRESAAAVQKSIGRFRDVGSHTFLYRVSFHNRNSFCICYSVKRMRKNDHAEHGRFLLDSPSGARFLQPATQSLILFVFLQSHNKIYDNTENKCTSYFCNGNTSEVDCKSAYTGNEDN